MFKGMKMTFSVKYDKQRYKNDLHEYLIQANSRRIRELGILLIITVLSLAIHLLNKFEILNFSPTLVYLSFLGAIGAFGFMLIFDLIYYIRALIDIKSTARNLSVQQESLTLKPTHIEFTWNNSSFNCFWNSYKNAIRLKESLILVPIKRGSMPVRINKYEIGKEAYSLIIKEIEKRYDVK